MDSVRLLNSGMLKAKHLKHVRLNYCLFKHQMLEALLPSLTKNLNIEEVDLAANELDDRSGKTVAMIV